jgi:hypothetical protein
MDTPIRAMKGKLNSKVNGENILTFEMFSHYYDEEIDDFQANPFIKLLVNERKVKLRYGAENDKNVEWYDFIIKKIEENSEDKIYTYTAKNLFANELSKSGFELEFDTELENNMGTVEELGERILEGTDWVVKRNLDNPIRQKIEEPLYVATIAGEKEAKDMLDTNKTLLLKENDIVYIFYNNIVNKTPFMQFLWSENEKPQIDDDNVIISESNWYIDDVKYTEEGLPDFVKILNVSDEYRGDRLVRKSKTTYDATIDKYVGVYYDSENKEVYGFMETEYNSPALVQNYITNGTDFTSEAGWAVGGISSED